MTDRLDRITQRAESHPDEVFNNLFSVITDELLWTAFRRLKRNKAPGVDGVTVDQYEENLLRFGRFACRDCQRHGEGAPGTFDFLGFTHYCGLSRAGKFKPKRKTASKKFRAKVHDLKHWFRQNLTTPLPEVWAKLNAKLRGHYQYYGINDNWSQLMRFRHAAKELAFRWLNRRSQRTSKTWPQFDAYMARFPLASPSKLTNLIAPRASVIPGDM